MRIAIDFDGTIVEHKFPEIGREVPGAIEWMLKWSEAGAELVLWTMRSDSEERPLFSEALEFCWKSDVPIVNLYGGPVQADRKWTDSPKLDATIYVDDAAFGCPLTASKEMGARPYVDWDIVGPAVLHQIKYEVKG